MEACMSKIKVLVFAPHPYELRTLHRFDIPDGEVGGVLRILLGKEGACLDLNNLKVRALENVFSLQFTTWSDEDPCTILEKNSDLYEIRRV